MFRQWGVQLTEGTTKSTHGGSLVLRDAFSYPLSVFSNYSLYDMQFGALFNSQSVSTTPNQVLTVMQAHTAPPSTRPTTVFCKHPYLHMAVRGPSCLASEPRAMLVWTIGPGYGML